MIDLERKAKVFKALAHPTRLQIVLLLAAAEEKCVCEIIPLVGASQPMVSRHLAVLREAGIVASRKKGLEVHYRLTLPCVAKLLDCLDQACTRDSCCAREEL